MQGGSGLLKTPERSHGYLTTVQVW